ncbi:MAG TPA: type II toxin-antitoxin system RelE/ParE family toxin [Rhodothermales bacterium]|nr:type II toxin-antitoxin system RelE/ParE family toxin [Rhodothermales bacterium]
MAEVVWTPRAYADLEAIGAYHAQNAPGYAELLVRKLMQAAERLTSFPQSGRVVPEIGDAHMREVIHRNYRIVYLHIPAEDKVEVLTVFHSSRQLGKPPGEASL